MDSEQVVERFRSAVRADIARGGAKPLRSYIRQFGVRFADEITREYAALTAPSSGLSLGQAPAFDPLHPTAVEPPASVTPVSIGLPRLGTPLAEKEEIARGGMGAIVRVRDEALQRDLAMKVVLSGEAAPSHEALLRFVDEARVQARLDHPGVVPIHHLGTDESGRICFTMKLVAGRSLAEILAAARRGEERANLVKTVQTLLRVCETVAFAHDKGVIHRDLKPANVMVGAFGEVYVMDWGLAKTLGTAERLVAAGGDAGSSASSSGLTQVGAVVGTPTYMPPEQAQGKNDEIDARSDVYSIGAILYEALAGRAPYHEPGSTRSAIETLRDVVAGAPPALSQFAPRGFEELVAVAEKAMARDPAARYPSARELGEDLQSWIEGKVVRAHRTGAWAEFTKWVRRNKAVAGSVAASIAVIAVVVAGAWHAVGQERDDAVAARNSESAAKVEAVRARDQAVESKNEAVAAARRADGLRLATVAGTKADEDATLASLLAYEGALRAPGAATTPALHEALRGFGELHTLVGSTQGVKHGVFSPDGRVVYTGSRCGRVIAWDVETGREIRRVALGHNDVVALEPLDGGRRLLAVALASPARVLDAGTLATVLEISPGSAGIAFDADVSPDGTKLATAQDGAARVVDLATGAEISRFPAHRITTCVRFSPDGARVATSGEDYHVRVWEASSGRETADLALGAPKQPPTYMEANPTRIVDECPTFEWSADGTRLVVLARQAPDRDKVGVWDAATGRRLFAGDASASWVDLAGLMPGGRVAIVDELLPKNVKRQSLVDLTTGAVTPVPWNDAAGNWHKAAFSADGRLIALVTPLGDRYAVGVWATESGVRLRTFVAHAVGISECVFSPDGARLLTCGGDEKASLWELASDAHRAGIALRATASATPEIATMDAAGDLVAVLWKKPGVDAPAAAEIARSRSGAAVLAIADPSSVRGLSLSPDGGRVSVVRGIGLAPGSLEVLDVPSGRSLVRVDGRFFQEARFDASGRRLAFRAKSVGGRDFDDAAFVLDVEGGGAPRRFDNPDPGTPLTKFEQLTMSPDGTRLAAAQAYAGAVAWDVESGKLLGRYRGHTGMMMGLAFSADGARLASSAVDTSVQVHDVASGAELFRYTGLPRKRSVVAFSPDGGVVAAVSFDVACVIDARTGRELGRIPRPEAQFVPRAAIGADGRLVAALKDGTVRTWPLDPTAWFASHRPRELAINETLSYAVGDAAERTARELARCLDRARIPEIAALASSLAASGRAEDAERCIRRARELDPNDYFLLIGEARLAESKGDLDAAFAALRRALSEGAKPETLAGDAALAKCRADPRWKTLVEGK